MRVAHFLGEPRKLAEVRPSFAGGWAYALPGGGLAIQFGLKPQEASQWCWCAITQGLSTKYLGFTKSQQDTATDHIHHTPSRAGQSCAGAQQQPAGVGNCAQHNCSVPCNGDHKIDVVLAELGFHLTPNFPLFDAPAIQNLLNNGPVVVRIDYGGVGHFILVTGWQPAQGNIEFFVQDPLGALVPNGVWVNPIAVTYGQLLKQYPPGSANWGVAQGSWAVA